MTGSKRSQDGRFTKGNPGGPGRPRKVNEPAEDEARLQIGDADELVLRAREMSAINDTWRVIIEEYDTPTVIELIHEATENRGYVPSWVRATFGPPDEK